MRVVILGHNALLAERSASAGTDEILVQLDLPRDGGTHRRVPAVLACLRA